MRSLFFVLAFLLASYPAHAQYPFVAQGADAHMLAPHLGSGGAAPIATVNAHAGTSGSCSVDAAATDRRFVLTLVTGSGTYSSGAQCAVAFAIAYTNSAYCSWSENAANDSGLFGTVKPYLTTSTTTLTLNFGVADSSAHTFVWTVVCED